MIAGTEAGGAAGSGAGTEAGGAAGSGGTTGAEDLQRLEGCADRGAGSVGESTLEPRFCLNDGLGGLAGCLRLCFFGSTIIPPTKAAPLSCCETGGRGWQLDVR